MNCGKMKEENEALRNVVEEMERDYARVVESRNGVYESYRSERDHVFVGRAELGQERKAKWRDIDRQRN